MCAVPAFHVMKLFTVLVALTLDPIRGTVTQLPILEVFRLHVQKLLEVLRAYSYEDGTLYVFGHLCS